jgi:hypothetical protein
MKRFRAWRLKRRLARIQHDLELLHTAMAAAGLTRAERRRIWREIDAGRLEPQDLIGKG